MVLRGIKGVLVNTNGSLNSLLSNGWCTRKRSICRVLQPILYFIVNGDGSSAQWLIDLGPTGGYDSVALLLSTFCCT